MTATKSRSVQAVFLDHVEQRHVPVSVFLLNGARLEGIVVGHDDFTIQIAYRGQVQTVYKQSISAISPKEPIELWEGAEAAAAAKAKQMAQRRRPGPGGYGGGGAQVTRITRRPR